MKNPLITAYQAVDNALMYGANKAVHAWNWTTGKTKTDLANTLLAGSFIGYATGSIIHAAGKNPTPLAYLDYTTACLMSIGYPVISKRNRRMEEKENKAQEAHCLDGEVEDNKRFYKGVGGLFIGAGIPRVAVGFLKDDPYELATDLSIGAGNLLMGFAQGYVIRADTLPPRKNCIRRGLENLAEGFHAMREKINPQPNTITLRTYHE